MLDAKTTANMLAAKSTYESFLPKESTDKNTSVVTPVKSQNVGEPTKKETIKSGTIKTGDTASAGAYGIALTGAVLAMGVTLKKRKTSK